MPRNDDDSAAQVTADIAGRTPRASTSSLFSSRSHSPTPNLEHYGSASAFDAPPSPTTAPPSPSADPSSLHNPHSLRMRKRAGMLRDLLSSLDTLVLANLAVTYYLDTLSLLFLLRTLAHRAIQLSVSAPVPHIPPALAPILSAALERQTASSSPQLALLLGTSLLAVILHLGLAVPCGSEASRGYLHGGLFIDFVGQKAVGPWLSRIRLISLDLVSAVLSVAMVCVLRECLRCEVAAKADAGTATGSSGTGLAQALLVGRIRRMRQATNELARGSDEAIEMDELNVHTAGADTADDEEDNANRPILDISSGSTDVEAVISDEHPLDALYSGQVMVTTIHLFDTLRNSFLDWKAERRLGNV